VNINALNAVTSNGIAGSSMDGMRSTGAAATNAPTEPLLATKSFHAQGAMLDAASAAAYNGLPPVHTRSPIAAAGLGSATANNSANNASSSSLPRPLAAK
jgi:hypothetical protein